MSYSKLLLTTVVLTVSLVSVSSATLLKFQLKGDNLAPETISHIHFRGGGNSFGGLIARTPTEDGLKEKIVVNGNTVECTKKISGLYYNAQRGERLWPLDETTSQKL
jgi:hypothetical protein